MACNRDLTYIAKQTQEHLKTHINHTLPLEYRRCMNGINQVLKQAWQISQSSEVNKEDKLAALSLANNCYKFIIDTIKYVQGQMDHLNNQEKKLLKDIRDEDGKKEEPTNDSLVDSIKTTNGVF
jgi:hypothetical protein